MAEKILFRTALTDVESTDVEGVGTLRKTEDGTVYRWVKNSAATAIVQHQPVCYDVGNADGTGTLFTAVKGPLTADLFFNAGIAMTGLAVSGGICYGWTQVYGVHLDARVLGVSGTAVVVGDQVNPANGASTLTRVVAGGTAPNRGLHYIAMETCSNATGATYAKNVFVKCL